MLRLVKKRRKLKKSVRMASFTYGDEKYEDGVCNVFFFPRGTSTGGLIELEGESGRSFEVPFLRLGSLFGLKTTDAGRSDLCPAACFFVPRASLVTAFDP